MRLSVFAYHVQCLALDDGEFTLHPCEGVAVKVKAESEIERHPMWDTVYFDGQNVGNRAGAIQKFTNMVIAAKPVIELD